MRAAGTGQGAPTAGREKVLLGLMLTSALAAMDVAIVATAVPSIVGDLGGFSLFTWVFSIYLLSQAVTIPIDGKLADLYGRKPVLMIGTVVFIIGSVLCGIAWNMVALIAFRGLQGIGAGAIMATTTTIAGDLYTVSERGRVQGLLSSVWGISAVIGPAIGGFFAEYTTWRWIFYINVPIAAVAMVAIGRYLHERVERRRHQIDYAGALLLVIGAGLLILGLLEGGVRWEWQSTPSLAIFAGGIVALAAFVWQEQRAPEPMMPLWVFSRRLVVGVNLSFAALGLLTIGLQTFLPTFAQGVLGTDAITAGFILAAMSIIWPGTAALSARFYMRIGFRDTALIGMIIGLVSALLFTRQHEGSSLWGSIIASLIMGAGAGLISTGLIVGIQSVVGWERRGVITGSGMFTRYLGQSFGAAIYGSIANATLSARLRDAPADLKGALPSSLNATSDLLGGSHKLSPAARAYLEHGLYLASHRVFMALVVVAVFGIVALLATPRHFKQLNFGDQPAHHVAVDAEGRALRAIERASHGDSSLRSE